MRKYREKLKKRKKKYAVFSKIFMAFSLRIVFVTFFIIIQERGDVIIGWRLRGEVGLNGGLFV